MQDARQADLMEHHHMTKQYFSDLNISELADTFCLYDEDRNDVYAIGGVDKCTVWMMCTHKVEQHPIPFLRFCKDYLRHWQKTYNYLSNYVWLGNELHVKWLKFMGAKFDKTIEVNGHKFQYFYFIN